MEVLSLEQARHFLREKPIRVNVIDRPRLTAELLCLEPGQSEQRQSYDISDNLYIVIEGNAVIRTVAQMYELGLHDALVVPPGVDHAVQNRSTERLTMLAFVAPKPARASEVRMPRQQRDFSRPRPAFRPAARDEEEGAPSLAELEAEVEALLGEEAGGETQDNSGERRFPPRREFGDRRDDRDERGPRRDFGPPRRDFASRQPPRQSGPRREFSGGHETRPRRDFGDRPQGNRPPFGGGQRRDFGDRPQGARPAFGGGPRRDFGDRPQGNRPPFSGSQRRDFGDRPQGGPRPFSSDRSGDSRGARPFGNRPPARQRFDRSEEQGEERPKRRPPVSREFYPKKPNQTGGGRDFGGRSSQGGRPAGGGRGRGGPQRPGGPNRPRSGPSGRPGPGRNGPRTSGRRPAP